ncbi:MAG: chemotaxis protein CheA [Acidobacteria bacterium]|nr:chemotaxis protein CheA [Acidobacteriota bacterium]
MSDLDNIVKEFLVESYENLDQLDRDLVVLETNPSDQAKLASIFRTIHTIKGTCGFLAFSKLEGVAHVGENLLGRLRDGKLVLNAEITSALLATVDAVREMLRSIENSGNEGDGDYSALTAQLKALQEDSSQADADSKDAAKDAGEQVPIGEILVESGKAKPSDVEAGLQQQQAGDPRHLGEIMVEKGAVNPKEVVQALNTQAETRTTAVAESNIRVDVGVLDKLMNLVGELVLARNQILQYNSSRKDSADTAFTYTTQRLNLITTELQEGVMKTRMQPIDNIWSKFPRVVRDLALACGKEVRIEMEGKETELDKTIIEAIKDPLTHLVRNSVDHGIETPEVRTAAGKPAVGRLLLRAFHEGGQVNIEITDDGAGIDPEKIKQKALEKGLITSEQAAQIGEREQLNLIFLPGLSTAEKVTNVSGRGVGMDVVKTNVEKIGGVIDISSTLGHGSTVKMKIPLTLAIVPALVVACGGDRYAIPQVSLLELVRLEGEQAKQGVETIQGASVYRLRGKLLPLVYLSRELGIESTASDADVINIVVLQAEERQFGLVVEGIHDTEEIVVKPLGKLLKGISIFAGSTIMGDGSVALILDVLGLAQRASVVSDERERTLAEVEAKSQEEAEDREMALLFEVGKGGRMAIPLSLVARLEEIPIASIETTGEQSVVQYRGEIMPLIDLSVVIPERRQRSRDSALDGSAPEKDKIQKDKIQVVVYSDPGGNVGLVVNRILDIVEEKLAIQRPASRPGVLGSLVIKNQVTELLDVKSVIQTGGPNFLDRPVAAEVSI